jgi:hypothetical protein
MATLEQTQVRLRLTKDQKVLAQLKKNRALKEDDKGLYLPIMFDGSVFYFRPHQTITVSQNIGNALIRSSAVIMGDHLVGEYAAAVEKIGSFELGVEPAPSESNKTACPICNQPCYTFPRLARHLATAHAEEADLSDKELETAKSKSVEAIDASE